MCLHNYFLLDKVQWGAAVQFQFLIQLMNWQSWRLENLNVPIIIIIIDLFQSIPNQTDRNLSLKILAHNMRVCEFPFVGMCQRYQTVSVSNMKIP